MQTSPAAACVHSSTHTRPIPFISTQTSGMLPRSACHPIIQPSQHSPLHASPNTTAPIAHEPPLLDHLYLSHSSITNSSITKSPGPWAHSVYCWQEAQQSTKQHSLMVVPHQHTQSRVTLLNVVCVHTHTLAAVQCSINPAPTNQAKPTPGRTHTA